MRGNRMNRWLLALLYILAFALLLDWLIPIMELTNTGQLPLFLLFIVLAFMFSFFGVKWWITVPVKMIYIFWVVHSVYIGASLLSLKTIGVLVSDIASNFSIITNGGWEGMTNPFRTTLFFILLWMTTYLVRYWIETKRSILFFYILTVLFIAFIDTFSAYSADGAIFRIMATGLLLLGLLFISKLTDRYNSVVSLRTFIAVSIPLLFTIVVSGLIVSVFPNQKPIWPDPIPYFQSVVDGEGESSNGTGVSKSGYGSDDSKLGGPFIEDDTLIFEAAVDNKQYWRVETKNTYTSKGWEQTSEEEHPSVYYPGMRMDEFELNERSETGQSKQANVKMMEVFPYLIYPYGMTKVDTDYDVSFLHLVDNGQYWTQYGADKETLDSYEIQYMDYDFSLKELRATTMESLSPLGNEFFEYLQLPEELPMRVGELARTISASSESVYDKTKAIERYFERNGFSYAREGVAIPENDDDYVDQFLFDTKIGYCDNFSSSMVVMLRTIGIPARWVKGFAPGDIVRNADDERVYHITNNEAHSWVEAYMPGIGWMPFEPTIGFSGPADIDYDVELEANDPEIQEMPEDRPEQEEP